MSNIKLGLGDSQPFSLGTTCSKTTTIDSGFGSDNTLVKECQKPKFNVHLSRENFLSEFKTEEEKRIARENLGVYSKEYIDSLTGIDTSSFVTEDEVKELIKELEYVNSTLKSSTDYDIPENLFKL